MKRKKFNNEPAKAIVDIHRLLKECIVFENIENEELICKNLNTIKAYKGIITDEMYSAVDDFIVRIIRPIVYDADYFDFMKRDEYGEYNEEGHFIINSDRSLEMMIFLMYERTVELNKQLDEFASLNLYSGNKQVL